MPKPPPGLIWLASYPKSGNTWLRLLLANILSDEDQLADINRLTLVTPVASSREEFARRTLVDSNLLTAAEIDRLRPALYRYWSMEKSEAVFLKVHDAFTRLNGGEFLLGNLARRAVYVVRDPRDIVGSLANHLGISIDDAVVMLCDRNAELVENRDQFRQRLLDWSGHVLSWLDQDEVPVLVVRYEDFHHDPIGTLGTVLDFLGVAADVVALERAVSHADFAVLHRLEQEAGFIEKPRGMQQFFRRGRVGDWQYELTESQISCVEAAHADVMALLNYKTLN